MFAKIAQDLFNLILAGLVLWGFGWMLMQACQTKPKPQSYRKRRQR